MKKPLFLFSLLSLATIGFSQVTIESGSQLIVSNGAKVIATNGFVNNGGSIDVASTGVIEIKGDLVNNSTALITGTSTGTFKFNGISAQEITGNHDAEFYGTLEIDNSNGVSVTNTVTGADQTIYGTLVFTDGLLTLNEFDLTLANDATTPGSTKYVQTNGTGVVKRTVGSGDVLFPVGNSAYNPVTLNNTGTSDIYNVRVVDAEPAGTSTHHFVNRSWIISDDVPTGGDVTITPQWNSGEELTDFDRTNSSVGLTTNGGTDYIWTETGAAIGSDPYSREGISFTTVGTFTVGDYFAVEHPQVTQQIDLTTGWNIASFNITPDHMQTDSIFKSMMDSAVLVKAIDEAGGFIQDIPGVGWLNTIGDMANTEGYYVKVSENYELTSRGVVPELPFDIPLITGWNIMGYPMDVSQDAENALQDIIDNSNLVKVIDEAGGFIQEIPGLGWFNTIGDFDPGEGYYIKLSGTDTLTVDIPATRVYPELFPITESKLFELPWSNNPYNPMNIIVRDISLDGIEVREGDEIAVFDGELCVGAGVVVRYRGELIAHIIASMDDPTTDIVNGFKPGNSISFKFLDKEGRSIVQMYHGYTWGKNRFEPLETYVCTLSESFAGIQDQEHNGLFLNCYPNPTTSQLYVSYILPQKGEVKIEIVDIFGNRVIQLNQGFTNTDLQLSNINMASLNRGVYVLKLSVKTDNEILSVIKKVIRK